MLHDCCLVDRIVAACNSSVARHNCQYPVDAVFQFRISSSLAVMHETWMTTVVVVVDLAWTIY